VVYLARHGETAWSLSGQHTGLKDLPLTERGERNARRLGERLKELNLKKVFTSPLQRARRTCELSGFGAEPEVERDLVERNYGEYEGLRPDQIHAERPDWELFRDGCNSPTRMPVARSSNKPVRTSASSRFATAILSARSTSGVSARGGASGVRGMSA
jgi:broad specificity phosphatase PhoE